MPPGWAEEAGGLASGRSRRATAGVRKEGGGLGQLLRMEVRGVEAYDEQVEFEEEQQRRRSADDRRRKREREIKQQLLREDDDADDDDDPDGGCGTLRRVS